MLINQALLSEYQQEAKSTRKLLERVPFDKADWKPHPKSMSLKELASHVAELPSWMNKIIEADELDFAQSGYVAPDPKSTEELLQFFEDISTKAESSLARAGNEKLMENWTLRNGDKNYFTMPKVVCLRSFVYNHLYHHRGQLTVYLRMLDVPLPGIYGPTADDPGM